MNVRVFGSDGSATEREAPLAPSVFAIEPNDHVIWLDVRRIQTRARQGTHKAKERGEVKGSTRKLYRQKGTGHARAGASTSPLRRGGGTFFGPRPRQYRFKMNAKASRLARRSALSYKAQKNALCVVGDLQYDQPSARNLADLIETMGFAGDKVLVLTETHSPEVYRSSSNLPRVRVKEAQHVSTLDILNADVVVFEEGALTLLTRLLDSSENATALRRGAANESTR